MKIKPIPGAFEIAIRNDPDLESRISKLPKWARLMIVNLCRTNASLQAALKASTPKHPFRKTKKNP